MYGLVNNALRDLIVRDHGAEAWERIRLRAGAQAESFVTMKTYPDDLTYGLVAATERELAVDVPAFLHQLGEHWILFAAEQGHGPMLERSGRSLLEFLQNLDAMHARIALTFPELRPPSFRCSEVSPRGLTLHYYSTRPGLAPFVRGLLSGLSKRFSTPIELELIASRETGHDHDVFELRLSQDVPGSA